LESSECLGLPEPAPGEAPGVLRAFFPIAAATADALVLCATGELGRLSAECRLRG
jgi:hypothetical protein